MRCLSSATEFSHPPMERDWMDRLTEPLLERLGPRYVLAVMIVSRIVGATGGGAVLYYVDFTQRLPAVIRYHFWVMAVVVIVFGCSLTVVTALRRTIRLRSVLRQIAAGTALDEAETAAAGREAVGFAAAQHRQEAWLVPATTLVPTLCVLKVLDNASLETLGIITAAVFMAISMVLMSTFFLLERCFQPVIRKLLQQGIAIDYARVRPGSLRLRFTICFSLIIVTTALMIGTLARQRASEIYRDPANRVEALEGLMRHSTYITLAAVVTGILYANMLTTPVATRLGRLVRAMSRVAQGDLRQQIIATGTDEVDVLARQFNAMVSELERYNQTVWELNAALERRVDERTQQLEQSMAELRATQAQLVHAEKMNSLGQLVAGVAHELNNSINAVYNGIGPLRSKLQQLQSRVLGRLEPGAGPAADRAEVVRAFDKLCRLADVIEHGAARTARIVSDLKTFSHPGKGTPERFDLNRALRDCAELLLKPVRHRIRLHEDYRAAGDVYYPKDQVVQVVLNILTNAVQAIAERGEIWLTTEEDDREVVIRIRDTGEGIPAEVLGRIFDPFYTTKPPGVGTGLGLSISYGIVRGLGGTIECQSQKGAGSEFVVRLPALDPTAGDPGASAESQAARPEPLAPLAPRGELS